MDGLNKPWWFNFLSQYKWFRKGVGCTWKGYIYGDGSGPFLWWHTDADRPTEYCKGRGRKEVYDD